MHTASLPLRRNKILSSISMEGTQGHTQVSRWQGFHANFAALFCAMFLVMFLRLFFCCGGWQYYCMFCVGDPARAAGFCGEHGPCLRGERFRVGLHCTSNLVALCVAAGRAGQGTGAGCRAGLRVSCQAPFRFVPGYHLTHATIPVR